MAVWPDYSTDTQKCTNWGGYALNFYPGWTWFVHKATARSGHYANSTNTQFDQGINSGMATIAMADGHVKAFKRNQIMRCDFNTAGGVWTYTFHDPRY